VEGVVFVRAPSQLATSGADVILLDLDRPGALDVVPAVAATGRVVGFGSLDDREPVDAARAAGVREVLARSEFFRRLRSQPGWLTG
jgi:hypothetical protein